MPLDAHPAADLFPMMDEAELSALAEDIRANGLRQPIVLVDGKIGDGRNRYRACEIAGVEPRFEDANGDDPLALVVSLNVRRRNLTAGQKAVAAAEAWDLVAVPTGGAAHGKSAPGGQASGNTRDLLAQMFGVGKNQVQQARALDADLASEVKGGGKALSEAYQDQRERDREADEREARRREQAARRERMRDEHPDLFERLERGEDIATVFADLSAREEEAARAREVRAGEERVAAENLTRCLIPLRADPLGPDAFAAQFAESLGEKLPEFDAAVIRSAGEVLLALAERREHVSDGGA